MWLCWSNECVIGGVISSCHNDESVQHARPTCYLFRLLTFLGIWKSSRNCICCETLFFLNSTLLASTEFDSSISQRLLSMATPPERVVGVVYVVDSSLTLASEWSTVLKDYISHLLQRIMALYHPAQVCQRSFRLRPYSTYWLRFAPQIYRYVLL